MILVLTGTGPDSFERLVKTIDELAFKNNWDIFIQLGHTVYEPVNCCYERFINRNVLLDLIRKSEIVVTQGGYGSIRDAISCNKPVVAVPRKPELNESPDNQEELVKAMEQHDYLIGVYDINDLESKILESRSFQPRSVAKSLIPEYIRDFVSEI